MLLRVILSAVLLVVAVLLPLTGVARLIVFLIPYAVIGWDILFAALRNIAGGRVFDEQFLMSVATVGALACGEYPEAVFVMLFYQVGEMFQRYAVGKSRRSIAGLMDIRPDSATVERDGVFTSVDPEEVAVGEIILIKPGERIALDGTVCAGASAVDTAALTGEALPRDVEVGDSVLSGCVNLTGPLRVEVTKPFGESTVSKILDLVENAGGRKAGTERFITRFARYYTPIVVFSALALAVLPPLFVGGWAQWIHRALIFLVVSCPCALVISVPLSFFGGIGGASRAGILIKGGNYLEALAKTDTVVFDKTGTLTRGVFRVTGIYPQGDMEEGTLLELAALAEHYSGHPISQAIRAACPDVPDEGRLGEVRELAGRGVQAEIDGRQVLVGNPRLMEEAGAGTPNPARPDAAVHLCRDGVYLGCLCLADEVKPEAADAIASLRRHGVRKTVMLTGDALSAAEQVAGQLGLDEVHAGLLPADKVAWVEKLLAQPERRGTLTFVGDGLNDAPVLSRADVGVAMGAMGSDAAIEAADIVLMDDNPQKLPTAIAIARKTMRIVSENIAFAIAVKVLVMVLSAVGVADMWQAVFADVGVSVIAILNAMRALRPPEKVRAK